MRGRLDACTKRLVRIQRVLDTVAARGIDTAAIARWRDAVKSAYGNGDQAKINEIWTADQWLFQLINNPDEDVENPKAPAGLADPDAKVASKRLLSDMVLRAVLEPMHAKCDYLLALRWQEKAERLDEKAFKKERLEAFSNADYWWTKYVTGSPLTAETVRERFDTAKAQVQVNRPNWRAMAVGLLDFHGKTIREAATARVLDARALLQTGKRQEAIHVLKQLVADAANLEEDARRQRQEWTPLINSLPIGPDKETLRAAVDSAFADLGPGGSLFWLKGHASLKLAELLAAKK